MPGLAMTYDVENRLAQTMPTSNNNKSFVYNPWNQKVWRTGGGGDASDAGVVTMYGPNGEQLADFQLWIDSPGSQCVPPPGRPGYGGLCLGFKSEHLYFAGQRVDLGSSYDRLGTAVMAGGSTTAKSFYPYGELKSGAPATEFATYQRDSSTNLDYANNRWYSSQIARFTTPDPYQASGGPEDPQSWNRYAYADGDPVGRNDPTGRDGCSVDSGDLPAPGLLDDR